MNLPDASWRWRPGLDTLMDALGGPDGLSRYVGGVVRDTLLGLPVSDLDVATALSPDEVLRRLAAVGLRAVPTGLAHGTVTAVLPDGPVEVTTLRRDVATDGRHAVVAFTDDWRADAARRDFTINALSADPASGTVHDYFAGIDDLAAGLVRFIGDPLARIAEDHLRILRFFRFHARFGRGAPDGAGLDACAARAEDLAQLSRERIAQELLKLLGTPDPVHTVRLMVQRGIFAPVLPEIGSDGADRLARLVARERDCGSVDPLRRLAALLPPRREVADAIALRLKLSNAQRRRLALAAEADLGSAPRALAYLIGVEAARDRLLLHATDAELADRMRALERWTPPRLPIGGGDLVRMGLPRGPVVAATLREVERQWIEEGFPGLARTRAIAEARVAQAVRDLK